MQVQFDLDQIALSNLNFEIQTLEEMVSKSLKASHELERNALSGNLGCAAISQQLRAHENVRQNLSTQIAALEKTREIQRKKSTVSFAKWRVSKRLT